jgi:hypothetical protein
MDIHASLQHCRSRAGAYLAAQVLETQDEQYWRHSPTHNCETYPEHLLYGTWAGVLASVLLELDTTLDTARRRRIANALNRYQTSQGAYLLRNIPLWARQGHDDEYLAFHCTNYALGALHALGESPRFPLSFLHAFDTASNLETWFHRRNWDRPWTEGNNIVNLASLYAWLSEQGEQWGRDRLVELADLLDQHQNPRTGFWHLGDGLGKKSLLPAMAGAAHNLHIYYYLDRRIPHAELIIDNCLRLGYLGVRSACVDIDVIDILSNMRRYGYQTGAIDTILKQYLVELLQVQNPDGGFCDNYVTPHVQYGHTTPAGISVTWATWFRMATIAMIASVLLPITRGSWSFRRTLGTGYWNPAFALGNREEAVQPGDNWKISASTQLWLATRRQGRILREKTSTMVRSLISQ